MFGFKDQCIEQLSVLLLTVAMQSVSMSPVHCDHTDKASHTVYTGLKDCTMESTYVGSRAKTNPAAAAKNTILGYAVSLRRSVRHT